MGNYDKAILSVLVEAGDEGLSLRKISRHVHNACNTLFEEIAYEEVHAYVRQYLQRNSRNPLSLIEKTDVRGVYRLNPNVEQAQQLMLHFRDEQSTDTPTLPAADLSLALFPDL